MQFIWRQVEGRMRCIIRQPQEPWAGLLVDPADSTVCQDGCRIPFDRNLLAILDCSPIEVVLNTSIEEPKVVGKSYPDFWKDLEQLGFETD